MTHAPDMIAFDLETLGVRQTSIILSLGVVPFNLNNNNTYEELIEAGAHVQFDVDVQKQAGLTWDQSTIDWWEKQSQHARQVFDREKWVHPIEGIRELERQLGLRNKEFVHMLWWCRGPHFDGGILLNMLQTFEMPELWYYQNCRDTRTFFMMFPSFVRHAEPEAFIAHNAMHDAAMEAYNMQTLWRKEVLQQED